MKTFLLFEDRDLPTEPRLPNNADVLTQDLELGVLVGAMADGDRFLADIASRTLLESLGMVREITYRQDVVRDALEQEQVVRDLYDLAVEAITRERKIYGWLGHPNPSAKLSSALEILEMFVALLRKLRAIAQQHGPEFRSAGFTGFFARVRSELDDAYFAEIDRHLRHLRFSGGIIVSARLDERGRATDLTLRRPEHDKPSLGQRWDGLIHPDPSFEIPDRDQAGAHALTKMKGRGLNAVADALARSTNHILDFFQAMRTELAFYLGCLNLSHRLQASGQPLVFPTPQPAESADVSCEGLVDASLALISEEALTGNHAHAAGRPLILVTGANRGGKSTFLRSVGLAQLMMQAGMPVSARSFSASITKGLFTHFKREEDAGMSTGKLEEELVRMRDITADLGPGCLVLFNEAFASTNEREGSEIGREVVRALLDSGVRVAYVTHLYDLARRLSERPDAYCLRAERERTFALAEGRPLPTSYGGDLYRSIFGTEPGSAVRVVSAESPEGQEQSIRTQQ